MQKGKKTTGLQPTHAAQGLSCFRLLVQSLVHNINNKGVRIRSLLPPEGHNQKGSPAGSTEEQIARARQTGRLEKKEVKEAKKGDREKARLKAEVSFLSEGKVLMQGASPSSTLLLGKSFPFP